MACLETEPKTFVVYSAPMCLETPKNGYIMTCCDIFALKVTSSKTFCYLRFDWLKITRVKMAASTNEIMLLCSILIVFITLCSAGKADMKEDQIKVVEFDVKPGGEEHTYETEWVNRFCCGSVISETKWWFQITVYG